MNIKKMRKREIFVYEIDQKRKSLPTEVDAHPAICVFRVSDEDTSSVRVLLFYCLWESIRARACTPFDSLSLSFSFFPLFKCSSLSIVVCCLFTCTDRRLLRISSLFPVQFMAEKLRGDTYVCDNRSFIFLLVFLLKCSYGRQCNKQKRRRMRKNRHWLWSVSIVIVCLQ